MKKALKVLFGYHRTRAWFIVTAVLIVILIVANILIPNYADIISVALGGDKQVKIETVASDTEETVQEHIYEKTTKSKEEANEKGFALTQKVSEEGTILLKNNDTLPLTKEGLKVSVFGKNSVKLVYGGNGSGSGDGTFAKKTIFDSLTAAGVSYNDKLKAFYEDDSKSGKGRDDAPALTTGSSAASPLNFGETPLDSYTSDVRSSYTDFNDAAIVIISRIGFESSDLPKARNAARDQKHALALDKYERELIDHVADNFENVIVVLNTLNIIEVGDLQNNNKVDGILWIGGPGSTGIMALGEILTGKVNPSGHTVDTWAKDFTKDPTWNNFSEVVDENGNYVDGSTKYNNAALREGESFVRYQEDIYIGYRYYETRAYEEAKNGNATWYQDNVVYPFGYGLSYTGFDWTVESNDISGIAISKDAEYSVTVKVTNNGDYAGKDVVQLYVKPHYNENGLEKSHVVLVAYAKTKLLAKGESDSLKLTFSAYDFASYDNKGVTGKVGYVVEAGNDYELYVCSDSHTQKTDKIGFTVASDIRFETDPTTGYTVENRYTDQETATFNSDYQLGTTMSRTSFVMPSAPTDADRNADETMVNALKDTSHNNPLAATYTSAETKAIATDKSIKDLLKFDETTKSYYAPYDGQDDLWNELIGAVKYTDLLEMVNLGGFKSNNLEAINKPETLESDGPVGWYRFIAGDDTWTHNCAYASQVVLSSTWNIELAEEMGECVGEEALWGAVLGDGRSYSGWYAPGVNLHRSPFCGRNFEYYSEDPVLAGKTATALVQGCKVKGVYCYVKHFVVNEQETLRSGAATYLSEQALRELYLKPFEITVKEGGATGIMSSFNRLGTRWTGGDYRLLTEILRNEWGFKGTVISDYNTAAYFMNVKQMVFAGGDLNLATDKNSAWTMKPKDADFAAEITVLRKAAKNIIYTVVNSNAFNPIVDKTKGSVSDVQYKYTPATWKIVFWVSEAVIGVGLIVWGVLVIISAVKLEKKKEEEASATVAEA